MIGVIALVPYPPRTTPSQRFRIEQWMPWLEAHDVKVALRTFADDELMRCLYQPGHLLHKAVGLGFAFGRRLAEIPHLDAYDVIVVHRAAVLFGPALVERMAAARRPLVFDFDDSIYLRHTAAANRLFGWLKFSGKTAAICRMAAHVVVGNEHLAAYARRYNEHVTVVPTSIDVDQYRPTQRVARARVVVGWTGSATSQTHLEMFAPVLRELAGRRDIEVHVVSGNRPHLPGVPFVWTKWTHEGEAEALRDFDIGIMPMPDDEWSKGKCAAKALQCMAAGAATVASAVGTNRQVIEHNVNGLLVTTPEEWLAALLRLVDDPEERRRLGEAGRRTVEERYSMPKSAAAFATVLEEVARGRC